jgi:hypothetical protein
VVAPSMAAVGAVVTADGAAVTAGGALATADGAVATAGGALATADGAVVTADGAVVTADGAAVTAGGALATADGAVATAGGALATADGAVVTADGAVATAGGAMAGGITTAVAAAGPSASSGVPVLHMVTPIRITVILTIRTTLTGLWPPTAIRRRRSMSSMGKANRRIRVPKCRKRPTGITAQSRKATTLTSELAPVAGSACRHGRQAVDHRRARLAVHRELGLRIQELTNHRPAPSGWAEFQARHLPPPVKVLAQSEIA